MTNKIVKLSGGLGNQMFQYAFAYALAQQFGVSVLFDLSWFEYAKAQTNITPRALALKVFDIDFKEAQENDLKDVNYSNKNCLIKKILWKMFKIKQCRPAKNSYVQKDAFKFEKEIFVNSHYLHYDGYFQNEKYFIDCRDDILKSFCINIHLNEKNQQVLEEIRNINSVSIHVRRGDYVTLESANKFHGLCSLDYYKKAIKHIANRVKNPHFFIFSDDIDWVIENLKIDYPYTIIDFNQGEGALDLNLMKNCKHNIISNSSFSWWGAWLNENPNKIVIAPQKWNLTGKRKFDVIPKNWVKF